MGRMSEPMCFCEFWYLPGKIPLQTGSEQLMLLLACRKITVSQAVDFTIFGTFFFMLVVLKEVTSTFEKKISSEPCQEITT